jgi:FtsP/CotA-like multicopper oxidase with cupredoxin domain
MHRRNFLQLGSLALANTAARRATAVQPVAAQAMQMGSPQPATGTPADITLNISPVTVELAPDRVLSTIGYNGTSPGPVLRMKEGEPITVNVVNDTDTPELVHWHGLTIPAEADGVEEENSPFVPPRGRRSYTFTPAPSGSRWYHSHAMAMSDLHKGAYTGQFGFLYIEPASNPGNYDQEHFLALRDWEPFFTSNMDDDDDDTKSGPQPEKPATLDTRPNGLEVNSLIYSINDKSLGSGEPLRVKQGQRVLLHLLNASAIENRRIALAGHKFQIIALDGNPVPTPGTVDAIFLGAGERASAIVEMNNPGVWILGATEPAVRAAGLGLVVEYENQHSQPKWLDPSKTPFDYTIFGHPIAGGASSTPASTARPGLFSSAAPTAAETSSDALAHARGLTHVPAPDQIIEMAFEKIPRGAGKFNTFTVNGKQYPHENEFVLKQGARYRLVLRNRTDDAHPLHLHRHQFELVDMNGTPTSGVIKDTVVVPYYARATVDFTANQPGLTLFHCHIQAHMDYGFKALFRYA